MKVSLKKIIVRAKQHQFISLLVILFLVYSGYYLEQKLFPAITQVRYLTSKVSKGTIVSTISGTGQIAALSQVDLKPQSSGMITQVNVKQGDLVKKGQVLVALDQRDASVSVLQAQASLASAQSNYNKLVADNNTDSNQINLVGSKTAILDLEKAKVDAANSIADAQAAVDTAYKNLQLATGGESSKIVSDAYQNGVIYLQGLSVKLDDLLNQADNILGIDNSFANSSFKTVLSILDPGKLTIANSNYVIAKSSRNVISDQIIKLNINSDHNLIDGVFVTTEDAVYKMMVLLTSIGDVLTATQPINGLTQASLTSMKSSMTSARSSISTEYSNLLAQKKKIADAKDSYDTYQIAYEKTLRDLEAAKANALNSVSAKELALEQSKQDIKTSAAQLETVKAQLLQANNDYSKNLVIAPFDGEVASVAAKVGDQSSATIAAVTLVTQKMIAQITLNEVDMAKVKIGQKVNLTFDAIPDLEITGEVAEIDTIGTVTQGVVNYGVKIALDIPDDRIKPGMSVSASIITNVKIDVLSVPNSAVKTSGSSYVEVLDSTQISATDSSTQQVVSKNLPVRKIVEVGIANDTNTEIVSGLNEGDLVVTQTISGAAKTTAATTGNTGLRIPGITGGGSGFRPN